MSNIPEPKFKKGDKVKTNELFKHEYAGDPGFRGIVGLLVIFPFFFFWYVYISFPKETIIRSV